MSEKSSTFAAAKVFMKMMPSYDINRIIRMEALYNELQAALAKTAHSTAPAAKQQALASRQTLQPQIDKLAAYYQSDAWKADFHADELGFLPSDLPRGILSEDGIYNLLTRWEEIVQIECSLSESPTNCQNIIPITSYRYLLRPKKQKHYATGR
ncbi:MAG: DUF4298 domain-containing protein [Paludibacteraceae bacterium]|nr:DUF4298 domain-containing protein [Paludibacteraceae bacterium]